MKVIKKIINQHLILIIYVGIGIVVFWKLFFTFFQQDEWAIFGNYIYWEKAGLDWWQRLFVYEQGTHVAPLSNLFFYPQFKLFGMNFGYYAFCNIFIHSLNAYLLYILAFLFTKNRKASIIAGLFFLINEVVQQAVTWTGTSLGTTSSVTFLLLSLVFLMKGINDKDSIKKSLLASLCWIISLLFKETSVFFILVIPVLWFFYSSSKSIRSFLKLFSFFVIPFVLYLIFRLALVVFWGKSSGQLSTFVGQPDILVYFFRIATFPFKFLAQSFVSQSYIIAASKIIVLLGYPHFVFDKTPDPYIVETVGSDIVSYLIAFATVGFSSFLCTRRFLQKIDMGKLVISSLLSIGLSSLPFILIPGKAGNISLIDGRHLYLTSVFSSIFLAGVFFGIYTLFIKRKSIRIVIISTIILLLGLNAFQIRKALNTQIGLAFVRTSILQKIYTAYPKLPKKVIFYTESNTAFYGLPDEEKILPFQSGFGQTLLVWYSAYGQNFPACFFEKQYLYVLLDQDYKQCGGRGFGYYRNMNLLKNSLTKNNLSQRDVIAFRYNSFINSFDDISQEVQNKLQ